MTVRFQLRDRAAAWLFALVLIGAACANGDADTGDSDPQEAPEDTAETEEETATEVPDDTATPDEDEATGGSNGFAPFDPPPPVDAAATIRSVEQPENCFVDGRSLLLFDLDRGQAEAVRDALRAAGFEVASRDVDEGGEDLPPDDLTEELGIDGVSLRLLRFEPNGSDDAARHAIRYLAELDETIGSEDVNPAELVRGNQIAPHYLNGFVMGWASTPGEELQVSGEPFDVDNHVSDPDPSHVLVIDSGLELGDQPDAFEGRVTGDDEKLGRTEREYGHGTFVAGIIAQVDPSARVTVVGVGEDDTPTIWEMEEEGSGSDDADTSDQGSDDSNSDDRITAPMALEETVLRRAVASKPMVDEVDSEVDVINMSLGTYMCRIPVDLDQDQQADAWIPAPPVGLAVAMKYFRHVYPGAEIVAAAGNDGLDVGGTAVDVDAQDAADVAQLEGVFPFYPAAYDGVHAVGALDMGLQRAVWEHPILPNPNVLNQDRGSNYGAGLVWAPGRMVSSSYPDPDGVGPPVRAVWGGTSFAAACVSGLLSLDSSDADVDRGLPGSIVNNGLDGNLFDDEQAVLVATDPCWAFSD